MTNYKILLKDGIPCAVDVPNIEDYELPDGSHYGGLYEHDLQQAIDNAVPFEENKIASQGVVIAKINMIGKWVPHIMTRVKPFVYEPMKEGKLYPCPEGFQIVVEDGKAKLIPICKHEGDEVIHQGDGFVYKTCANCGEDI